MAAPRVGTRHLPGCGASEPATPAVSRPCTVPVVSIHSLAPQPTDLEGSATWKALLAAAAATQAAGQAARTTTAQRHVRQGRDGAAAGALSSSGGGSAASSSSQSSWADAAPMHELAPRESAHPAGSCAPEPCPALSPALLAIGTAVVEATMCSPLDVLKLRAARQFLACFSR
ncbi:hypothetical protein ABPG75_011840 [Micractinium tetrahymenae]